MPPKVAEKKTGSAKAGGKDAKGKGGAPAETGDEFDKMTEAQLVEEQRKLQEIYDELKRKRNFFQLEKDQIQQFYDITHQEVQEDEASVRNIEAQMQKMQETHRSAIKLYLQKVVHLEYQHGNALDTMNKEAEVSREMDQRDHDKRKEELLQQCQAEREATEREEVMYEEEVRNLRELERKEMAKLRDEFERNHTELMAKYEQRLQELKDDLELKRKMEIHEIEERKNKHINDLMRNHERAFTEMKAYYNSITRENLELIKTLKDDLAALKSKAVDNEKTIEEVTHRNEMLSEPLSQAESKVAALRARLQNYEKDKASLKLAKARLLVLEDKLQALLAEQESLNAKYLEMEKERDELYAGFEETVIRVQERSNAKNEALSKRLDEYQGAFDTKKVQFATVLRASNLDPVMLQSVMGKLDDVLTSKNDRIQELHYEAQRLIKTKDELEQAMDSHLSKQNIPETVGSVQHPTAEQYVSDEAGTLPPGLLSTSRSPKHPQPRSPPRSPGATAKASPNLSLNANAMPIQG